MIGKTSSPCRPGELLVRLRPGHQLATEDFLDHHQLDLLDRFLLPGPASGSEILHLKLPPDQELSQAQAALEQDPRVAYAATNDILESFSQVFPNDFDDRLWGIRQAGGPESWTITTGDRDQAPLVAIIDSGVDYTHPDLAANVWRNPNETLNGQDDDGNGVIDDLHGFNAADQNGDPMDSGSHGTHVAGTIAAVGNNGLGVVGMAWQAQMMPIKFLSGGFGTTAAAIAGLLYAEAMGARITSNSWGGGSYNQALVDTLASSSALHICAAGNSGNDSDVQPLYPAAYDLPNIVSVAATDRDDQLAPFSNYGAESVDLAAPGVGIYSTVPDQSYSSKSGTSMATPHVTGVASLILERFPELDNQQLKDRLMLATDRLSHLEGKVQSGGRLNAWKALQEDAVPPAAPLLLEATTVGSDHVDLRWLAPGDDGFSGQAAAYELRYGEQPLNEENFQQAAGLPLDPPQLAGRWERFRLPILPSGRERRLHLGLRAVDKVGNRGPITSLQADLPAAQVAFEDEGHNSHLWLAEGQWGQKPVPGRGLVWSDSPEGLYRPDADDSLTSRPFSLEGFENPVLAFDCRYDLEITFDKVHLEVSPDGQSWTTVDSFNRLAGWHRPSYRLADWAGEPAIALRFRLVSDGDVQKTGFEFDNLVVTESREPRS